MLFAGPTQMAGKTTLAFQLLEYTATPKLPAYVAVSKPKDPVTLAEGKRLGYRFVDRWPVERKVGEVFHGKPPGYIVWPEFGDIDQDAEKAAAVTAALLRDRYKAGVKDEAGILVCDDTVVKSKLLGLDRYMTTHIAMAGAMDLGGWYFVQKPTDSGKAAIWAYGNAAHIFISHEGDQRNRRRYDEISGFDTSIVAEMVRALKPYQFVYLQTHTGRIAILDSQ